MARAKQLLDRLLDSGHLSWIIHLHDDLVDRRGAEQAHLASLERDQDRVILITTDPAAFTDEGADHRKWHVANADQLTDGRCSIWKQIGHDCLTEDRDIAGVGVVLIRKERAAGDLPILQLLIGRRDGADARGPVLRAGDDLGVPPYDWTDRIHAVQRANTVRIGSLEGGGAASAG